jgi:hypothetical protein
MFVVAASMLLLAAALGGSLGLYAAQARQKTLFAGVNYAGPLGGDVTPAQYVACLGTNWNAVFFWDTANSRWLHYFPPSQVPGFVNSPAGGGFTVIHPGQAVAILMKVTVQNATLPDSATEQCP